MSDYTDKQAAIDALNEIINKFEQILRDIRESKIDDSVCGMCEYDGAYIGESGNWYNECPGFDKDDCFKLSDECRKRWLKLVDLPSVEVEPVKHGRWSHYYDDVLVSGTCSVCGWQSMIMETDVADMPYCPNCGTKMDIEEEGA